MAQGTGFPPSGSTDAGTAGAESQDPESSSGRRGTVRHGALGAAAQLADLVTEMLDGSGVTPERFWDGLERIIADLAPRRAELLAERDRMQADIDAWLIQQRPDLAAGRSLDPVLHAEFLRSIGYLGGFDGAVEVSTAGVDPEISDISAPQLVVPLDNARYALNAANARWGSLYAALYGSDAIGDSGGAAAGNDGYNPIRGEAVMEFGRDFLDRHFALARASHRRTTGYSVADGALSARCDDGSEARLAEPGRFAGYRGDPAQPDSVLLRKHGLGCEISFSADSPIGSRDRAGIDDVRLESAVTAIMDCEDSVAAVGPAEKLGVYRNWHGLMTRSLTSEFAKDGRLVQRRLSGPRVFSGPRGEEHIEPGRALMLVRLAGLHLEAGTAIVDHDAGPIPEMFLDCALTAAGALADLNGPAAGRNSRTGAVYMVTPKLHGPAEVELACELFARVEDLLGLDRFTLKMGIMDEERRTSLNLRECLHHARRRAVFVNSGFLDRTACEIHTAMEAGPVLPKGEMHDARWLHAYEDSNVDVGLACGLDGRGQIGKGMWAKPARMAEMLEHKAAHPRSGANCAWVPSPTAATLHATHYFDIDVAARRRELVGRLSEHGPRAALADMLELPLLPAGRQLADAEIDREIANNAQGVLGYVVRWVGLGVGCSTVPDIDDVGLMEDLATLRISSQHMANWLHHGVVSAEQVTAVMRRMAAVVDRQNSADPAYAPMTDDLDASIPFAAALELVFGGRKRPDGYTESVLRSYRRRQQALAG